MIYTNNVGASCSSSRARFFLVFSTWPVCPFVRAETTTTTTTTYASTAASSSSSWFPSSRSLREHGATGHGSVESGLRCRAVSRLLLLCSAQCQHRTARLSDDHGHTPVLGIGTATAARLSRARARTGAAGTGHVAPGLCLVPLIDFLFLGALLSQRATNSIDGCHGRIKRQRR